jgi:transaldolase
LSVFVGRIYDAGVDGFESMVEINKFVQKNSKCQTLWASTRMPFDFIKAEKSQTNIITMPIENIKKLNNFGYDLKQYSIDTVQQFYNDAKSCGFKI